jgi:hypothetical protein
MALETLLLLSALVSLALNILCAVFFIRNLKNIRLASVRYDKTALGTGKSKTGSSVYKSASALSRSAKGGEEGGGSGAPSGRHAPGPAADAAPNPTAEGETVLDGPPQL